MKTCDVPARLRGEGVQTHDLEFYRWYASKGSTHTCSVFFVNGYHTTAMTRLTGTDRTSEVALRRGRFVQWQ